MIDSHTGYKYK